MTSFRFLNGLNTIGGNIIEFVAGNSRILMDFGVAQNLGDASIETALANGTLPAVPELFVGEPSAYQHEAIFISHLHIDHMGALQYLNTDVPIYLSEPSYQLYQTLIELGIEAPVANLHPMPFNQAVTIGDFNVTGMPSDHDEPGIMALLVEADQQAYLYSGDVRLNGPAREAVVTWAKQAAKREVDLLLLEGTSYSFDDNNAAVNPAVPLTEITLQERFTTVLADADKLVVINPYIRNYRRLAAFNRTAKAAGRQMVWSTNHAKVLTTMTSEAAPLIIGDTIDLATLAAHPEAYVLQNDFDQLNQLAELPVSVYLHSNGEPLGDYNPRFARLKTFLSEHQIPLAFLGASGHASQEDLITLAQWVAPKLIVPWHSFHPEREAAALKAHTDALITLPEKNRRYSLAELRQAAL